MFDPKFYGFVNPSLELSSDAAAQNHFNETGWREGRDPNAFFNTAAYLRSNPDVAGTNRNPFQHYQSYGKNEGRQAVLSNWGKDFEGELSEDQLEACLPWIDAQFIRSENPSLAALDDRVVCAWYLIAGWRNGCDPSTRFSTSF